MSSISGVSVASIAPKTITERSRRAGAAVQVGIALVEHPFDHRPGHHREAGNEVHVADREAGDLVVRVGDDRRALRKDAHVQAVHVVGAVGIEGLALLGRDVAHALEDQRARLRVQRQRHAQRGGRALARVVVGRGADAAAGEHQFAAGEGVAQRLR